MELSGIGKERLYLSLDIFNTSLSEFFSRHDASSFNPRDLAAAPDPMSETTPFAVRIAARHDVALAAHHQDSN